IRGGLQHAPAVAVKLLHDLIGLWIDAGDGETGLRHPHESRTYRNIPVRVRHAKLNRLNHLVGFWIDALDFSFLLAEHPQRSFAKRERHRPRGNLDALLDKIG